jgi:hypothetical protein
LFGIAIAPNSAIPLSPDDTAWTLRDGAAIRVTEDLFGRKSDAAWYLAGLAGFWGGFAALTLVAAATGGRVTTWLGAPLISDIPA